MDDAVVDTDVASLLQRQRLPDQVAEKLKGRTLHLSFITTAEMLRGAFKANWGRRRIIELEQWLDPWPKVNSDDQVSEAWAKLVAQREQSGRPIGHNDAWIAACCVAGQFPLATLNRRHFEGTEGLDLIL